MRILFIGHDAQRTGAPMVLLHLLGWIAENRKDIDFHVVLLEGGVLVGEYRKFAEVTILSEHRSTIRRIRDRIDSSLGRRQKFAFANHDILNEKFDLVLGNTVLSLPLLSHFKEKQIPAICWVHEMENVVKHFFEPEHFREMANRVDRLVLGSNAVKRMLNAYEVTTPTDVVYELQPPNSDRPTTDRRAMRRTLGIPEDAFVVLGCGLIGRRKGVDIFLDVAAKLVERHSDTYFIWVGGRQKGKDLYADSIEERLRKSKSKQIIFTGEQSSINEYFAAADVFALTSREDPFPLVCLVAAEHALPIVCFDQAGGIPEFVGSDAGRIVPQENVESFVEAIESYHADRETLNAHGRAARRKFEGPFSIDRSAARMLEIIEEVASDSS